MRRRTAQSAGRRREQGRKEKEETAEARIGERSDCHPRLL
jgi:hypothetical protein